MTNELKVSYELRPENELWDYLSAKRTALNISKDVKPKYVTCRNICSRNTGPKILLVFPPITIPCGAMKRCVPPLGLCYIAAVLRKEGFDVSIFDTVVEGYDAESANEDNSLMTYGLDTDSIRKRIEAEKPDIVGISTIFSTDLHNLYNVAGIVKKIDQNILVVAGGLHPTIYPKEVLSESIKDGASTIDLIIRGEGEWRMLELLKNLMDNKIDLSSDGLCGWHEGELFINFDQARIEDIDALPFPAYDLVPLEKYFNINVPFSPVPQGKRVLPVLTSRGCPIGCNFCASTNMYHKYITRSPDNIMQELTELKKRYDIDEVQFVDDNLTLDKNRAIELFNKMCGSGLMWCTPNGTMINALNEDIIGLMQKSGLYQITLSIDSASVKSLKNCHNKPVRIDSIPALVKKANDLGIFSHGTLVVGMPGESMSDIIESLDFVYSLDLTSLSVFIAAAIPGSVLYHVALDNHFITKQDARRFNTTKAMMSLPGIDPCALEKAVRDFQKKYLKKIKDTNPELFRMKYEKALQRDPDIKNKLDFRLT